MKLIIDIPEKLVCEGFERHFTEEEKNILIKAIGNGTPLPKGHGRLIDANAAKCSTCSSFGCENWYLCKSVKAETIVEVDGGDGE